MFSNLKYAFVQFIFKWKFKVNWSFALQYDKYFFYLKRFVLNNLKVFYFSCDVQASRSNLRATKYTNLVLLFALMITARLKT